MATPARFPEANRNLLDNGYRSENVTDIAELPVWTDGEQCVSCWRLTWRERLSALLFGKVFLAVLSGRNQPPVAMSATRTYFAKAAD